MTVYIEGNSNDQNKQNLHIITSKMIGMNFVQMNEFLMFS